jgi:hypothetical protein
MGEALGADARARREAADARAGLLDDGADLVADLGTGAPFAAVYVQVASADAALADADEDLARPRRGVGDLDELDSPFLRDLSNAHHVLRPGDNPPAAVAHGNLAGAPSRTLVISIPEKHDELTFTIPASSKELFEAAGKLQKGDKIVAAVIVGNGKPQLREFAKAK